MNLSHVVCLNTPFKIGDFEITPIETSHDAINPCGFLIKDKEIVSTVNKKGEKEVVCSSDIDLGVNVAVIVNERTSGPAEIVLPDRPPLERLRGLARSPNPGLDAEPKLSAGL